MRVKVVFLSTIVLSLFFGACTSYSGKKKNSVLQKQLDSIETAARTGYGQDNLFIHFIPI